MAGHTWPTLFAKVEIKKTVAKTLFSEKIYHSRALKSRSSYGNSTLFLKRSQYISLDFYV
jgi:hypothetical protein